MRTIIFSILTVIVFQSCSSTQNRVQSVQKEVVLKDSISIRALAVSKKQLWYAGSQSKAGTLFLDTKEHKQVRLVTPKKVEFRSLAYNNYDVFFLSIGNPAQLYSGTDQLYHLHEVYNESHEKVFYDAIAFSDTQHGIAIGDPTDKALAVLLTSDGGKNWRRIPENNAPLLAEGEAAFAASNTNIITQKNTIWVITGGKKSRIWKSIDYGNHWQCIEIPIKQGGEMTGAFSAAFYNSKIGVVAGGDYSQQNSKDSNLVLTLDGGITWKKITYADGPGYISCIQFVPGSQGKELVTTGAGGTYYSGDQGAHWMQLDADATFYTLRFLDKNTYFAAGKNQLVKFTLVRGK